MKRWVPWIVASVAVLFLFLIRAILTPFVIAILLAYILVPAVDALATRLRVRRILIVGALYLILAASLAVLVLWVGPSFALEFQALRRDSVAVVERAIIQLAGSGQFLLLGTVYDAHTLARDIVEQARHLMDSPISAFQLIQALARGVAEFVLVFIALFYLLLDWESLAAFAFRFVPEDQRRRAGDLARKIHLILGAYLRGLLVLIVLVSGVTWIALRFFFNIPFALPIAIVTGFLEIIPLVGPIAAASIAAFSALSMGGVNLALGVILFYTVLRQVEDQVIAPNVLGRAVHVHPLAAIFAVLAGGALAGTLGLVLGVPAAATAQIILDAVQAPVSPELAPARVEPITRSSDT